MSRLHFLARFAMVLALAASTQGLLLAQASWLVNQEWIAETLCVNPDTDCDGKCQLADRMEKMHHGGHSHGDPSALLELALSVRAQVAARVVIPGPVAVPSGAWVAGEALNTGREASRGVFHPPRNGSHA